MKPNDRQLVDRYFKRLQTTKNKRMRMKKKVDLPTAQEWNEAVKKVGLRESISTGTFLAFVFGAIGFMSTIGYVNWLTPAPENAFNWTDLGVKVALWMIIWSVLIVIGFEKTSLVKFGKTILEVLYSPRMNSDAKLVFIKEQIEKLMGIALMLQTQTETGLSSFVNPDEKKILKEQAIKDVPKPPPLPKVSEEPKADLSNDSLQ